jgi:hypothetical protein
VEQVFRPVVERPTGSGTADVQWNCCCAVEQVFRPVLSPAVEDFVDAD